MRLGLLSAGLLPSAALAAAQVFQLHHRVLFPSLLDKGHLPAFSQRGSIQQGDTGSWEFVPPVYDFGHLGRWLVRAEEIPEDYEQGLYQVALQRSPDDGPDEWDLQSVRLCHVRTSTADIVSLQLGPATSSGLQPVYAFDYYVSPVPRDGSCPDPSAARKGGAEPLTNTTVATRSLNFPPVTTLRVPVVLSETGEPVKPPVQQSFIQKYWMYILGGMVILLLATPPEDDGGKNHNRIVDDECGLTILFPGAMYYQYKAMKPGYDIKEAPPYRLD